MSSNVFCWFLYKDMNFYLESTNLLARCHLCHRRLVELFLYDVIIVINVLSKLKNVSLGTVASGEIYLAGHNYLYSCRKKN